MKNGWNLKGQEFSKYKSGLWKASCSKCKTPLMYEKKPHFGFSSDCCSADILAIDPSIITKNGDAQLKLKKKQRYK